MRGTTTGVTAPFTAYERKSAASDSRYAHAYSPAARSPLIAAEQDRDDAEESHEDQAAQTEEERPLRRRLHPAAVDKREPEADGARRQPVTWRSPGLAPVLTPG